MASILLTLLLLLLLALLSPPSPATAEAPPPLAEGLSFSFYRTSCPNLEAIVRGFLQKELKKNVGLAAGLLRVHFHDCFVQGCDGSVLLDGSASGPSEQDATPNLTLRPEAFREINELRAKIDKACGGPVVSCADVLALAARDSVVLSGGPDYRVPLGRRDGLNFASRNATLASLPSPTFSVSQILPVLARISLDAGDLVALSGGHTIGRAHCPSFSNRIFPSRDPTMDQTFFNNLRRTCPSSNSNNTTVLDIRSPNKFDNRYYVDLMNRQGLFTSDEDLYMDSRTRDLVTAFAINESFFFERFAASMLKMGQLSVLTGRQGEIRVNCSAKNVHRGVSIWPVVEEGEGEGEGDSAAE